MTTVATGLESPPLANTSPFRSRRSRRAVLSLLLGLLTLVAYNPIAHNNFVSFDDPAYITANRHVHSGLSWNTVEWAFRSTEQANWHPLTWLSHAFDYQLFHDNPAGHHYANALLHAITVALLFIFLESTTGRAWPSAAVAALFAVHPINVESVAWASERKNVLCTLFFIVALYAYSWYVRKPNIGRYLLVLLLFACALMSKPMVVTFPFVLLLLDYWPLARMKVHGRRPARYENNWESASTATNGQSFLWLSREKLPFLILSAASAVITIAAQGAGGAIRGDYPLKARAFNAILSYSLYIKKALWPVKLSVLYPFPAHIPGWQVLGSALFILSITAMTVILNRQRYLVVGWFWYLGTLVPVIGVVQAGEQAMADRYAYIPLIGLLVVTVWAISDWSQSKRIAPSYLALAAVLAVASLGWRTQVQIGFWRNTTALWSHALVVTQRNFVAHNSLGAELLNEGRVTEAIPHFEAAAQIEPSDAFSEIDLGVCARRQGNLKAAIEHYEAALRLSSDPSLRSTAFANLGSVYRLLRDYARARQNFVSALQLEADNGFALMGMALVAQKSGDMGDAISYYSRLVTVQPSDVAYLLLAQALSRAGRKQQAALAGEQAERDSRNLQPALDEVNHLLSE